MGVGKEDVMNNATAPRNVSVLGLGLMGSALAEALLNAGHDVTVWNRTRARVGPLTEKGAHDAASAAEAIDASHVTLVCVTNHAAAMEILGTIPDGYAQFNEVHLNRNGVMG